MRCRKVIPFGGAILVFQLVGILQLGCIQATPCLRRLAGRVVVWGNTKWLGIPAVPPAAQANVIKISAYGGFALALTSNHEVIPWGWAYGQTDFTQDQLTNVQDIAAGFDHSLVLLRNGSLLSLSQYDVPADLANGSVKILAISAGYQWSMALVQGPNGGSVRVWSSADGWPKDWFGVDAVPLAAQSDIVSISAGSFTAVAVKSDGSVIQWGSFSPLPDSLTQQGVQLNNMSMIMNNSALSEGTISASWTQVAAITAQNNLALWKTGDLWAQNFSAWYTPSKNVDKVLRPPPYYPPGGFKKVVARYNFTIALSAGGGVEVWGEDQDSGVLNVPAGLDSGVIDISGGSDSAGVHFAMALIATQDPVVAASASAPAAPASDPHEGSKRGLSKGAMAGIIVAGVVGCLAITALALFLFKRQRQHQHEQRSIKPFFTSSEASDGVKPIHAPGDVAGLHENDIFLRSAAHNYGWVSSTQLPAPLQAVEAGINDTQLDMMLQTPQVNMGSSTSMPQQGTGAGAPAVQLTKEELRSNVHLLRDGLLGRGATALVFKCVWPKRFGPNALLAAKVVKDGYEGDIHTLESFAYEATVLASMQHLNVVRLYGYCLEPPTLCLILELLPSSLKDVLYKGVAYPSTQPGTTIPVGKHTNLTDKTYSHITEASSMMSPGPHTHSITMPTQGPTPACNSPSPCTTGSITGHYNGNPDTQGDAAVKITVGCEGPPQVQALQGTELSSMQPSSQAAQRLSCLQVMRLVTDMAAGLAHLHNSELPTKVAEKAPPVLATDGVTGSEQLAGSLDTFQPNSGGMTRSRIVHRDLKPANILINSQGVAKISDFGLARQHEHTTVATVHLGVGTLPYMAPELLVGAQMGAFGQSVTNRVDIYSLAIMLWEMLSGTTPWKDMSEMAIMAAVSKRQRPPLPGDSAPKDTNALKEAAHQPAHPAAIPQLNKIIRACWNQRDLRRPQAREVYAQLSDLLAAMQPAQGPASAPQHGSVTGVDMSISPFARPTP